MWLGNRFGKSSSLHQTLRASYDNDGFRRGYESSPGAGEAGWSEGNAGAAGTAGAYCAAGAIGDWVARAVCEEGGGEQDACRAGEGGGADGESGGVFAVERM